MNHAAHSSPTSMRPTVDARYERAVAASKRVRWEIDRDVLRGRAFDPGHKLLPDGLSLVGRLSFLDEADRRFFSQVQGRTYANVFGLVERFINAKVLERSHRHVLSDQIALEALVRFSDEELKHQELFRRVEELAANDMPPGYRFEHEPNAVASVVLGKSSWAVLALTCLIELVTQAHFKESILPDESLSPLFKDIFLFHWKEESQHALLDELEWQAEDRAIDAAERDRAVSDLIALVEAVDGIVCAQADADAAYFLAASGARIDAQRHDDVRRTMTAAYRWQYILSGVERTRFTEILRGMISDAQLTRIVGALAPLR